jgi:hypothetical protein
MAIFVETYGRSLLFEFPELRLVSQGRRRFDWGEIPGWIAAEK